MEAVRIPDELLLYIVERAAGTRPVVELEMKERARSWGPVDRHAGLGNLALVCRTWYKIVAPRLYSALEMTQEDIAVDSRPRRSTARHARMISLQVAQPLVVSASLPRLFPNIQIGRAHV